MADRPTGTVTFLFTDIEGSTRLLQQLGARYGELLLDHHRILRASISACEGFEVKTEGDAFFVVFSSAAAAIRAATDAQRSLVAHAWPDGVSLAVRMGVHTGEATLAGDEYVGLDIHRAARIAAAAHGGQVLVSDAVRQLASDDLPPGVTLRDMGQHRFKDLDAPEHLHQLVIDSLPADFPPIRSLDDTFRVLPTELTAFIGRDAEVERVRELLAGTRLLTLTGPGGTGKSRISMEVGRRALADADGGVVFVPLAPIDDAALVPQTIRSALALKEQVGRSSIETVAEAIAERNLLLVLDNFEQVLGAAPSVARLLASTRLPRLLVTSRAPLRITGEQEFAVPPMRLPEPTELADPAVVASSEAVALFMARARTVRPDFEVTAENAGTIVDICRRLDGLPLAIELAASRIGLLPPEALLARLGHSLDLLRSSAADRTDRQRTLRGAIDWSYELLGPPERAVFRRASVFVGGWQTDDAEAVLPAAGVLDIDVIDGLEALVEHSLMRQVATSGEPRFAMLATIREYGLELLAAEGELEATARAHSARFLALAVEMGPGFTGTGGALDRAQAAHVDLRAALLWAVGHGLAEPALEAAGALWRFWHLRGFLREGTRLTREALAMPDDGSASRGRVRALYGLGSLIYWQGDYPAAREAYDACLARARAIDDQASVAEALYALGFIHALDGDHAAARAAYDESRTVAAASGDALGSANALFGSGFVDSFSGNHADAVVKWRQVVPMYEALGDRFSVLNTMGALARSLQMIGGLDEARELHLRQLDGSGDMGDETMISMGLHDLARLAARDGQLQRALRLEGASRVIASRLGGGAPPTLVFREEPVEIALRSGLTATQVEELMDEGRALSMDGALALARQPRPAGQPSQPG